MSQSPFSQHDNIHQFLLPIYSLLQLLLPAREQLVIPYRSSYHIILGNSFSNGGNLL